MIGRTGIDFASAVVQPWNPGVTFSPSCGGFQGAGHSWQPPAQSSHSLVALFAPQSVMACVARANESQGGQVVGGGLLSHWPGESSDSQKKWPGLEPGCRAWLLSGLAVRAARTQRGGASGRR